MPVQHCKPLVLLSNDDGIEAPGLRALYEGLRPVGRLRVFAPAVDQSASSHSFSLRKPIRIRRLRPGWYAVHGTPTDCLLIAHYGILKRKIDIVVSGINDSPNLGDDVLYSGTVAAAIEGAMLGMPAVAVSCLEPGRNLGPGIEFLRRLLPMMQNGLLPPKTVLNVNIPAGDRVRGVRVTTLGRRIYRDMAIRETLPDGGITYTIDGDMSFADEPGTDFAAVYSGHISVTPLQLDMTHHRDIARLKQLLRRLDYEPGPARGTRIDGD